MLTYLLAVNDWLYHVDNAFCGSVSGASDPRCVDHIATLITRYKLITAACSRRVPLFPVLLGSTVRTSCHARLPWKKRTFQSFLPYQRWFDLYRIDTVVDKGSISGICKETGYFILITLRGEFNRDSVSNCKYIYMILHQSRV